MIELLTRLHASPGVQGDDLYDIEMALRLVSNASSTARLEPTPPEPTPTEATHWRVEVAGMISGEGHLFAAEQCGPGEANRFSHTEILKRISGADEHDSDYTEARGYHPAVATLWFKKPVEVGPIRGATA